MSLFKNHVLKITIAQELKNLCQAGTMEENNYAQKKLRLRTDIVMNHEFQHLA